MEEGVAMVPPLGFDDFDHAEECGTLDSAEDDVSLVDRKIHIAIDCEQEETKVVSCSKRIPTNKNIARLGFQQKRIKVVEAPVQNLTLNNDFEMFGQVYEGGAREGSERWLP